MAVTNAEKTEEKIQAEEIQVANRADRASQLLHRMLRIMAILIPVGLFTASILVSLVFWVSLNPVFGQVSAGLAIAGLIAAILAMFFFRRD